MKAINIWRAVYMATSIVREAKTVSTEIWIVREYLLHCCDLRQ